MGEQSRVKRALTVRGPVVCQLLGDPGVEPELRVRPPRDPAHPGRCPVCARRVVSTRLEEHLDCYDPDATGSIAEVAQWLGVGVAGSPTASQVPPPVGRVRRL